MYETQKKFSGNLHALRGLAALSVVFYHAKNMAPQIEVGALSFVQQFGAGVTLFFILSGFSLCLSNFDKIENPKWLYSYSIKRVSRILPVWYIFVAIHFVYHWIKFGKVHSFAEVLYHIVPFFPLIPGGHESFVWAGWTIGVELMFYILFPFLIICFRDDVKKWILATIVLILISTQLGAFAPDNFKESYYYMGFAHQAFIFILGCTFYFVIKSMHTSKNGKYTLLAIFISCCVFFLMWFFLKYPQLRICRPYGLEIKSLALGSLVALAYVNYGNRVNLYNRFTKFLGDKSYTLYLAHPIVVAETKSLYPYIDDAFSMQEVSFLLYSIVVVIITSIVATVISNVIEAPLYKKGKQYAEKEV